MISVVWEGLPFRRFHQSCAMLYLFPVFPERGQLLAILSPLLCVRRASVIFGFAYKRFVKAHSVKWAEAFTEEVKGLYGKAVFFLLVSGAFL
jgi:hypothetical protein